MSDKNNYLKKLHKIKEKLMKKGFGFWFDADGKLMSMNVDINKAKDKVVKIIKKDVEDWKNKILLEINITIRPDDIMDKKTGGLELSIRLSKVSINNKNISIEIYDEKRSLMRLFYDNNELDKFKLSDLKEIALLFLNKKIKKTNPFKYYHYDDIVSYFD